MAERELVKPDVGKMVVADGKKYWVRDPELTMRDVMEEFDHSFLDAIREEIGKDSDLRLRNYVQILAEQRLAMSVVPSSFARITSI